MSAATLSVRSTCVGSAMLLPGGSPIRSATSANKNGAREEQHGEDEPAVLSHEVRTRPPAAPDHRAPVSASSSCENRTGTISFVRVLPLLYLSTRSNCWDSGKPAGMTILPRGLSCWSSGGGMRSGAAVTITLSDGACSAQP